MCCINFDDCCAFNELREFSWIWFWFSKRNVVSFRKLFPNGYKIHIGFEIKIMKISKLARIDLQGSKLDDLTTDRLISVRSTDLRPSFDLSITFATCIQFWRFDNRLKALTLLFQSVIESSKLDTCSGIYGQIESWSRIDRSRRDQSIGCQIVQFGPL